MIKVLSVVESTNVQGGVLCGGNRHERADKMNLYVSIAVGVILIANGVIDIIEAFNFYKK